MTGRLRDRLWPREFILYADESTQKGTHYSYFFGGLLIPSDMVEPVSSALAAEKLRLNLHNEVKWQPRLMSGDVNHVHSEFSSTQPFKAS